jgi:hypothetical protein
MEPIGYIWSYLTCRIGHLSHVALTLLVLARAARAALSVASSASTLCPIGIVHCPSVRLPVCPSAHLVQCPSVHPSVCLSVCLHACLPLCLYYLRVTVKKVQSPTRHITETNSIRLVLFDTNNIIPGPYLAGPQFGTPHMVCSTRVLLMWSVNFIQGKDSPQAFGGLAGCAVVQGCRV